MAAAPVKYSQVEDDATVFRLMKPGGGHQAKGQCRPSPEWLAPNSADKASAEATGRAPGLSAWDARLTSPPQARAIGTRPDDEPAFAIQAGVLRQVVGAVATSPPYPFAVDVVHDPDTANEPKPGWEGHCLIEGLSKPDGAPKSAFQQLRTTLVASFEPYP